jgi:hypothetical protein
VKSRVAKRTDFESENHLRRGRETARDLMERSQNFGAVPGLLEIRAGTCEFIQLSKIAERTEERKEPFPATR